MELYSFDNVFYILKVLMIYGIGISLIGTIIAYNVNKGARKRERIKRALQQRTWKL